MIPFMSGSEKMPSFSPLPPTPSPQTVSVAKVNSNLIQTQI
jgi:hypothetical protein